MNHDPVRVLIVDDSSTLTQVIRRYLGDDSRISFYFANNGLEAETILQEQNAVGEPIQLMFLDWMMPKMTGAELLKKIRGIEIFKDQPQVIMVTAETNSDQINACLEYKVARYVIKPFTKEMITDAFNDVLNSKNLGEVRRAV